MEKGVIEEYLVVFAFFLCVVGCLFIEAFWLSKKGWAGFGKSFGFSALTNVIGFAAGFFVSFIFLAIILMSTLGGKNDRLVGENTEIGMFITAVLITPVLLIIGKRIFLSALKMQTGKSAWIFSIVSSILILIISLLIPTLFGYLLFHFSG